MPGAALGWGQRHRHPQKTSLGMALSPLVPGAPKFPLLPWRQNLRKTRRGLGGRRRCLSVERSAAAGAGSCPPDHVVQPHPITQLPAATATDI